MLFEELSKKVQKEVVKQMKEEGKLYHGENYTTKECLEELEYTCLNFTEDGKEWF